MQILSASSKSSVKNTLKRHVSGPRKAFVDFRRALFEAMGNSKYSKPGLYDLDSKLAPYLGFRNGFFIEAGSNDGYSQSNTYYLERVLGWSGILVEGIPELYRKCLKLRANSRVYNCALVAPDFQSSHVEMRYANLVSVVDGSLKLPDAQAEHIRLGLESQGLKSTYTVKVPARTLDSILEDLAEPVHPDFLSLDVEGYELNVLKGLNLAKRRPTFILVEARFFDEVNEYLATYYDLVAKLTYHDYLYKNRCQ